MNLNYFSEQLRSEQSNKLTKLFLTFCQKKRKKNIMLTFWEVDVFFFFLSDISRTIKYLLLNAIVKDAIKKLSIFLGGRLLDT